MAFRRYTGGIKNGTIRFFGKKNKAGQMRPIQSMIERKMNMRNEGWKVVKSWHSAHSRYEERKKDELTWRGDGRISQRGFFFWERLS